MNVCKYLHPVVTDTADRRLDPAKLAGVFDPEAYRTPEAITPDQFATDFARLRDLVHRDPGAADDMALAVQIRNATFTPLLRGAHENGHNDALKSVGMATYQALDDRLDQVRPDWSDYSGRLIDGAEDRHRTESAGVKSLFLRAYGLAAADELVHAGLLTREESQEERAVDTGSINAGIAALKDRRTVGGFLAQWGEMTAPDKLAHFSSGGPEALFGHLQTWFENRPDPTVDPLQPHLPMDLPAGRARPAFEAKPAAADPATGASKDANTNPPPTAPSAPSPTRRGPAPRLH